MPELPEVESFSQALAREFAGKTLKSVKFHRPDLRFPFDQSAISAIFAPGTTFLPPQRVAKQLVLRSERGMVAVSLGMSGSFIPSNYPKRQLHEHVTMLFSDNSALAFVDPRRFGFWKPVSRFEEVSSAADPLNQESLTEVFKSKPFRQSSRSIKDVLMDQALIGGLGNIYALECLYRAGVSPRRLASRVKPAEYFRLAEIIPPMLVQAIDAGGSTISTYRRLHGESGGFQELHLVYDRENEPCLNKNCRGTIKRAVQSGRSSWWCPRCQK